MFSISDDVQERILSRSEATLEVSKQVKSHVNRRSVGRDGGQVFCAEGGMRGRQWWRERGVVSLLTALESGDKAADAGQ